MEEIIFPRVNFSDPHFIPTCLVSNVVDFELGSDDDHFDVELEHTHR